MKYTRLEEEVLSPDAIRTMGVPASRMMAARGMAPLADPKDLLSVLYQLSLDANEKVASSAKSSAKTLPKNILEGALGSAGLDPRVIDYFFKYADCQKELVEIVILNQETADETVAQIAKGANRRQVDLIATNEERILRHPEILAALYGNTKARMSTIDRIVELAVRNDVKVPGIPAWDELCRAVTQAKEEGEVVEVEAMDALFASATVAGKDDEMPENAEKEEMKIRDMTIAMKIRLAMVGNKFQRAQLIRDPKKMVALAAIKSPSIKDSEAAKYASNTSISEEVIKYIANRKDWTKLYHIKLSLVSNPKCPLPSAMRLLPHLRRKDIDGIARSRSIPSALKAQAKKLKAVRSGGRG